MIMQVIKSIVCIAKDHQYIEVGKCPFTGNQYQMCLRCEEMVTK